MDRFAFLYVALGGAFGSVCRYGIGVLLSRFNTAAFPYPTFIINITGSFLMGLWIGTMTTLLPGRAKDWHLLIAVGVLGGYTTFSTFSLEAWLLVEKGLWMQASLYVVGSVLLSVGALGLGLWLVRTFSA